MSLSNECVRGVYRIYYWQGGKVNLLIYKLQTWRQYVTSEVMVKIKEKVNEDISQKQQSETYLQSSGKEAEHQVLRPTRYHITLTPQNAQTNYRKSFWRTDSTLKRGLKIKLPDISKIFHLICTTGMHSHICFFGVEVGHGTETSR